MLLESYTLTIHPTAGIYNQALRNTSSLHYNIHYILYCYALQMSIL